MRIILLNIDGLPTWALGAYGNEWLATPNFDEFAASAVIFDQHYADVPRALSPEWPSRYFQQGIVDLKDLAGQVLSWHESPPLQLPHSTKDVTTGDEDDFDPVTEAMEQLDQWLGGWLGSLQSIDDAVVVVTSGRGQPFLYDKFALHHDIVQLPLMIRLPGGEQSGRRIYHFTQTVDLVPTILHLAGVPTSREWHGHDLIPLCRGGGPVRDYVVMTADGQTGFALQTADEKIIVPGDEAMPRYYIKPDDRWEVNDLRQPNLDRAEELERTLRDFLAAASVPGPLLPPPLPQQEPTHGDRETGGREHDGPAGESRI